MDWLAGCLLAAAASILTTRPFWPGQWARHPWMTWVRDDFFYYLAIARNLAQGHGSTFDRLTPTNGYHPLWLLLLAAVCRISTAPHLLIGWVALTCFVATLATYACAIAILRRCGISGVLRVLLAAYVALSSIDLFFYGMEVTLAIPLALLLMAVVLRADSVHGWAWWLGVGLLVSALGLARLDALMFVALLFVALLGIASLSVQRVRAPIRTRAAAAFALGLLPLFGYFISNRLIFGLWLPISGVAKQLRRGHTPSVEVWFSVLNASRFAWLNLLIVVAGVALLPFAWSKMRAVERSVLGAALLFPFVFVLVLSVRSDWEMWPWYAWVWRPALCASFALWFSPRRNIALLRARWVHALAALVVLVRLGTTVWTPGQLDFYQAAIEVRDFAATHPGIYAMGDRAGMIAYLLPYPLVQTEGLVMDRAFLTHIERRDDLWQTLADYKVRYYIGSSWESAPSYRNGCYGAVEPIEAGAESPHMEGKLCEEPLLRVKHNGVETMIFAVDDLIVRGAERRGFDDSRSRTHATGRIRWASQDADAQYASLPVASLAHLDLRVLSRPRAVDVRTLCRTRQPLEPAVVGRRSCGHRFRCMERQTARRRTWSLHPALY